MIGGKPFPVDQASHEQESGWRPARRSTQSIVPNASTNDASISESNDMIPVQPIDATLRHDSIRSDNSLSQIYSQGSNSAFKSTEQIRELDLTLTTEMLKDPATWNLQPLYQQASAWRSQTTNYTDQQALDRLMSKIANCQSLQNKYLPATARRSLTATRSTPIARERGEERTLTDKKLAGIYDAHGTLQELVRNGGLGQSSYVLQDKNGKITHHVRAAPGVNLHRYLRQPVGIIGQRGFNQQSGLNHVTAHRVVNLNQIRR